MHRDGANPNDMSMDDILCDFCAQPWTHERFMVEGHRGSCICANCLTIAYADLVYAKHTADLEHRETCSLCLERHDERRYYRSPLREEALACSTCVKRAAGVLHKDKDTPWTKPPAPANAPADPTTTEDDE